MDAQQILSMLAQQREGNAHPSSSQSIVSSLMQQQQHVQNQIAQLHKMQQLQQQIQQLQELQKSQQAVQLQESNHRAEGFAAPAPNGEDNAKSIGILRNGLPQSSVPMCAPTKSAEGAATTLTPAVQTAASRPALFRMFSPPVASQPALFSAHPLQHAVTKDEASGSCTGLAPNVLSTHEQHPWMLKKGRASKRKREDTGPGSDPSGKRCPGEGIELDGTWLTKAQVLHIFALRSRKSCSDSKMDQTCAGRSPVVAGVFNVSAKSVRDIWNRTLGVHFTRPEWSIQEHLVHVNT